MENKIHSIAVIEDDAEIFNSNEIGPYLVLCRPFVICDDNYMRSTCDYHDIWERY